MFVKFSNSELLTELKRFIRLRKTVVHNRTASTIVKVSVLLDIFELDIIYIYIYIYGHRFDIFIG